MSADDKIKNTAEDLGGKVKEGYGDITGDKSVEAEGKADQLSAKIKDAAETVKDKAEQAGEDIKAGFEKLKDEVSGDDK